jgi:peptide-methionine (R)-S-oxide reductase
MLNQKPNRKSEKEWKKILSDEEYYVLRQKGTEMAFTGKFWNNHENGDYHCAGCDALLFKSMTKFDSGTGWPSFSDAEPNSVITQKDTSHGMVRTEVICANCGGHLGHLFEDGLDPSGCRYCINSISLKFKNVSVQKK